MTAVMPAGVATARDLVGPAMTAAVARLSPEVRTVAAYHLGLAKLNGHTPEHGQPAGREAALTGMLPADGRAPGTGDGQAAADGQATGGAQPRAGA